MSSNTRRGSGLTVRFCEKFPLCRSSYLVVKICEWISQASGAAGAVKPNRYLTVRVEFRTRVVTDFIFTYFLKKKQVRTMLFRSVLFSGGGEAKHGGKRILSASHGHNSLDTAQFTAERIAMKQRPGANVPWVFSCSCDVIVVRRKLVTDHS